MADKVEDDDSERQYDITADHRRTQMGCTGPQNGGGGVGVRAALKHECVMAPRPHGTNSQTQERANCLESVPDVPEKIPGLEESTSEASVA